MKLQMSWFQRAISIFIFALFFLPTSVYAEIKIGFFDLDKVLAESSWGKDVRTQLKAEEEKLKTQITAKQEEFRKLQEDFKNKQALLGEGARKQRIDELQQKQREGQQLLVKSQQQMQNLGEKLMEPLIEKVFDVVKELAKKEKLDLVFEARRGGLVYGDDKYDLTSKIIQMVDKERPGTKK